MNDVKALTEIERKHALKHLEDDVKAHGQRATMLLLPLALCLEGRGWSETPAATLRAVESERLQEAAAWGRLAAAVEGDESIIRAELAKCEGKHA